MAAGAGNPYKLWKELWDWQGKCSKMGQASYFSYLAAAFIKYNLNVSVATAGAGPADGGRQAALAHQRTQRHCRAALQQAAALRCIARCPAACRRRLRTWRWQLIAQWTVTSCWPP